MSQTKNLEVLLDRAYTEYNISSLKELSKDDFEYLTYLIGRVKVENNKDPQVLLDYYEEFGLLYDETSEKEVLGEISILEKSIDIGSIERLKYLRQWASRKYQKLEVII